MESERLRLPPSLLPPAPRIIIFLFREIIVLSARMWQKAQNNSWPIDERFLDISPSTPDSSPQQCLRQGTFRSSAIDTSILETEEMLLYAL